MEPVNWCRDIPAESVIESLGIKWTEEIVDMQNIDFVASSRNFAREDSRLDLAHAEGIANGRKAGKPIPYIVLRKAPSSSKYVIAGGNHRCKALKDCSDIYVMAYVVDCTNAEFSILCKSLNAVVGKGSDKSLRVKQATQAVIDKTLSTKDAARVFNVSTSAIQAEFRSHKGLAKVQAISCGKVRSVPKKVADALSSVNSDAVIRASIDALASGVSVSDLVDRIRIANEAIEESQAVEEINKSLVYATTKKVTSKKKAEFLRALSTFENLVSKNSPKSIDDFDIETEFRMEVRQRCKKIASTLNSL